MKIIGKLGCPNCNRLKEKYPEIEYIEVPDFCSTEEERSLKKKIGKLDFKHFPIIVDDEVTKIIDPKDL